MAAIAVRFSESTVSDLEGIRQWYLDQGVPDAGARLLEGILERVETLREHPEICRVVPEFNQPFLRELIHPPFRIVYRRDAKCVRVVRVWRSERLLRLQA